MSAQPASAALQTTADPQAERVQHYLRVLDDLIDLGADLARQVCQQAKAQAAEPSAAPLADSAVAFERVARSVRRGIMLAQKLAEPAPPPGAQPMWHRPAARRRILREVEDAIQRTASDSEAAALHAELLDRLDGPDLADDIDHRPVAEIIADICRDLGLAAPPGAFPWKRRTPDDIAALCARAAATAPAPTITPAPSPPSDPAPHPAVDGATLLHGPPRLRTV